MNELDELRAKIDELDKVIVQAYVERLQTISKIGDYKACHDIPVLDSGRENVVYTNAAKLAKGYEKEVYDLYAFIMAQSKNKQSKK